MQHLTNRGQESHNRIANKGKDDCIIGTTTAVVVDIWLDCLILPIINVLNNSLGFDHVLIITVGFVRNLQCPSSQCAKHCSSATLAHMKIGNCGRIVK